MWGDVVGVRVLGWGMSGGISILTEAKQKGTMHRSVPQVLIIKSLTIERKSFRHIKYSDVVFESTRTVLTVCYFSRSR